MDTNAVTVNGFCILEFGAWDLFGICDLEFGVSWFVELPLDSTGDVVLR